jgi:hypothetical protein
MIFWACPFPFAGQGKRMLTPTPAHDPDFIDAGVMGPLYPFHAYHS